MSDNGDEDVSEIKIWLNKQMNDANSTIDSKIIAEFFLDAPPPNQQHDEKQEEKESSLYINDARVELAQFMMIYFDIVESAESMKAALKNVIQTQDIGVKDEYSNLIDYYRIRKDQVDAFAAMGQIGTPALKGIGYGNNSTSSAGTVHSNTPVYDTDEELNQGIDNFNQVVSTQETAHLQNNNEPSIDDSKQNNDYSGAKMDSHQSINYVAPEPSEHDPSSTKSKEPSISRRNAPLKIIRNPMIAMIGVGEYDGMVNLAGIGADYERMMTVWVAYYNYKMVYQTKDNEIKLLTLRDLRKDASGKRPYPRDQVKLKWTVDEMLEFAESVRNKVEEEKSDGLIFIFSSHGDEDENEQMIMDSDCNEIRVYDIKEKFLNDDFGCAHLANKPKIFAVDACRGQQAPVIKDHKKDIATKGPNSKNKKIKTANVQKGGGLIGANFLTMYGSLSGYGVVDGHEKGGYLIGGIKDIFHSRRAQNLELHQLAKDIRMQTYGLAKGGHDKPSPVHQIVEIESSMLFDVKFNKRPKE